MFDIDKELANFAITHKIEKNFDSNPDRKFTFFYYKNIYNL